MKKTWEALSLVASVLWLLLTAGCDDSSMYQDFGVSPSELR